MTNMVYNELQSFDYFKVQPLTKYAHVNTDHGLASSQLWNYLLHRTVKCLCNFHVYELHNSVRGVLRLLIKQATNFNHIYINFMNSMFLTLKLNTKWSMLVLKNVNDECGKKLFVLKQFRITSLLKMVTSS